MFGPFRKVWAVDFEYLQPDWELSDPICLVAWELQGGQKIRLWENQFGESPPYSIDAESLFVSFAADAELSCHLALNWPMPMRVLDLRAEFKRVTNTTPVDPRYKNASLLQTLTYCGVDGINSDEKTYWRDLILRGRPWTQEEQEGILNYCETDVAPLARLLPAMARRSHIDLPRALLRGRYMIATTKMQATGVPIDQVRFNRLQDREESLKDNLISTLGARYGVYDAAGSFHENLLVQYLSRRGWSWPLLESGRLDLKDKTFKAMAAIHPELEPLRQLRYTLDKLKLNELRVSRDGFNRCWLNPFGSRTSRNQPSNQEFIFGPAVWLRDYLIRAKEGYGLAIIDWVAQEVGIAAGLSFDPAMMHAYNSEDFYITFGIQGGVLPQGATQETHGKKRESLKVTNLATQYGIGSRSLAELLDLPDIAGRELLGLHRRVYKTYWAWSDNRVNWTFRRNRQDTVFGWTLRFEERPKINSVRNFFMQGNGAEMLRLAACLATENGIQVCAPIHDAFLIMAPINRLQEDIRKMRTYTEEASSVILGGFRLRTDVHVFIHPDQYRDPKGRGDEMLKIVSRFL